MDTLYVIITLQVRRTIPNNVRYCLFREFEEKYNQLEYEKERNRKLKEQLRLLNPDKASIQSQEL